MKALERMLWACTIFLLVVILTSIVTDNIGIVAAIASGTWSALTGYWIINYTNLERRYGNGE